MATYFAHERLEVYQFALKYASLAYCIASGLKGNLRPTKDQLLRASQSIALNIAEGNAKTSQADKRRYLEISRGSAMECAAMQDILRNLDGISDEHHDTGKELLLSIVAMLTKLCQRCEMVREDAIEYGISEIEELN